MDLAVGGLELAVGAVVQRGVAQLVLAVDVLGDRAGDEVDPELVRDARGPRARLAADRLGGGAEVVARAERRPLLGEDDEVGAVGRGPADEAVGLLQVGGLVGLGVELDGGGAHRRSPLSGID